VNEYKGHLEKILFVCSLFHYIVKTFITYKLVPELMSNVNGLICCSQLSTSNVLQPTLLISGVATFHCRV
jgi:hypothetical protein